MIIQEMPDPDVVLDPSEEQDPWTEVTQLKAALDTRDAIGQAKGIIRLLTRCDGDDAFVALRGMSQDTNRKVKDVAVLFAECAVAGIPLPTDVGASWCRRISPVGDSAVTSEAEDVSK